jgi:hypothetical protein
MKQLQFLVKVVFARTLNRAQGQSLRNVAFYFLAMFGPMGSCMWHYPDAAIKETSRFMPIKIRSFICNHLKDIIKGM